jgi:hypothetical protein
MQTFGLCAPGLAGEATARASPLPKVGLCPTLDSPRVRHVAGVQGAAFGLKPPHPTTGTSAAAVQRQGFGFAPVLTRSPSALRLPGWPLTLPLRCPRAGAEKGSKGRGMLQGAVMAEECHESP